VLFRLSAIVCAGVNRKLTKLFVTILNDEKDALLVVRRLVSAVESGCKGLYREVTPQLLLSETIHLGQFCNVEVESYVQALILGVDLIGLAEVIKRYDFVFSES
jgi:hypothetical protein